MRRGGAGAGRRVPKPSLAPSSASEATPSLDPICRNLDYAFNRRDSDAASLCSSRPPSSIGVGASSAVPNFSDRASQAAALREVNAFLAPAVTLRPPLPAARDIVAALRHLLQRFDYTLQENFEDDLLYLLRSLGCPCKLTRSALKAPGTPHSWPPLLSVLHWLTVLARVSVDSAAFAPLNDLMRYTTQGYSHFIKGEDDALAALDGEYANKARATADAVVETTRALEKEAQELDEKWNKLTTGPSRLEAQEAENAALSEDAQKFASVVNTWSDKVGDKEEANLNRKKELEAKLTDAQRMAAENDDLLKKVEAQAVNFWDAERMHREMQLVDSDITKLEKEKLTLEDKGWELDADLARKHEELEVLAEQCNQALKRLKPSIDFQYSLNVKGSSPSEMLGLDYKTKLKPALKAYAEENNRIATSKLDESVDLQKQFQANVKILEERKNNISSLKNKIDEMIARMNIMDHEIENDDARCTADAIQMKNEMERKEHMMSPVEKEAADNLKKAELRLQDASCKSYEETQRYAKRLQQLLKSASGHREFIETSTAQRKRQLNETADYIASLPSKMSSSCDSS